MNATDRQMDQMASRHLLKTVEVFYQDPKNQKAFEEWLEKRRGNDGKKA